MHTCLHSHALVRVKVPLQVLLSQCCQMEQQLLIGWKLALDHLVTRLMGRRGVSQSSPGSSP